MMQLITRAEYFRPYAGHPDITQEVIDNCDTLLARVNALLEEAMNHNIFLDTNRVTQNLISGDTNGGFRPQSCPIGAPSSSHKTGAGIDIHDADGSLDDWLTDELLTRFRLYREDPGSTRGWVHLSTRAPRSGKRTFFP
jgi:hypothetical protein